MFKPLKLLIVLTLLTPPWQIHTYPHTDRLGPQPWDLPFQKYASDLLLGT